MKIAFVATILIGALGGLGWLASPAGGTALQQAPVPPARSVDRPKTVLAPDAVARRDRSNAILKREGVPLNLTLPVIESERDVGLPSTEEVTMRAVATIVVAAKGEGVPHAKIAGLIDRYDLKKWLSPHEAEFLAGPAPTDRERGVNTWRYEAAYALLWSLGLVDTLKAPRDQCDPAVLGKLLATHDRAQLLAKARLRPLAEILDQADIIYRYRWALVEARIHDRPAPAGLSDDVAMERHQVFNWLIYHAKEPWDEISLDT